MEVVTPSVDALSWLSILVLIAVIGITVLLGSRLFSRVAVRAPRTVRWTRLLLFVVVSTAVIIFGWEKFFRVRTYCRGAPPAEKFNLICSISY